MMKYKMITLGLVAVLATGLVTGCGSKETTPDNATGSAVSVESGMVSAFHDAIKAAYGDNYLPSMAFDEEAFAQNFNIDMANVVNYVAEVPMIGNYVDTLVIVEAAEGKVAEVETALNAYRDAALAETMQYPMNLAKINASKVYTTDEYVFFLMVGAIDETSETEEDQLAFAEAETQKAVDAIEATISK